MVLLLDACGAELIAKAAKGLEEQVRHGFRLNVGHGLAGTVAGQQHPIAIEHVDHSNVVSPLVLTAGSRPSSAYQ